MATLVELGVKNKTDKVGHNYLNHYEERFKPIREERFTLLELGIMRGSSLRMWRDFFPLANIVGVDITKESMLKGEERIQCYQGDQGNKSFLEEVAKVEGPLTLVIDDGSHRGWHHVESFKALWPFVNPGGWYCIEDAFSIFHKSWTDPGHFTILHLIEEEWAAIIRSQSTIAQVAVIGCDTCKPLAGRNNGLIFLQKAIVAKEDMPLPKNEESNFFTSKDRRY